jgi:Na+-transporting methylmalonyl-CoA/oxaloacetate decarboxylase gamma subunit
MNYQTVGMLILLGALAYLWLVVNRLSRTVQTLGQRVSPPAPTPAAPPMTSAAETPDEGVIAAIAAAVAIVLRAPHRIVAVQPDSGAQHAWSAEGRREIYLSHKIR